MSATQILISLSGQIGLLLFGIHMVTTGVLRALGSRLTRILQHFGLQNRGRALLTGIGVTALLQSSTATAMMVTAFTAGGVVDLMPGLAVMLGANIGTTLIVQLVSFDITRIFPALFLAGFLAYRSGRTSAVRDAATSAGLGITMRTRIGLPAGLVALDPVETGLPALPAVSLTLVRAESEQDPTVSVLAEIVLGVIEERLKTL